MKAAAPRKPASGTGGLSPLSKRLANSQQRQGVAPVRLSASAGDSRVHSRSARSAPTDGGRVSTRNGSAATDRIAAAGNTALEVGEATSRAANVKLELAGVQRLQQLVDLTRDPATSTQYRQQAAGLLEALSCFPNGFTPAVAQDGVSTLLVALSSAVAAGADGSERLVPPLIELIQRASQPLICATLEDQRLAESAVAAVCRALSAPLATPNHEGLRVAAAIGLGDVFALVRSMAGDDVGKEEYSTGQRSGRKLGETASWRLNLRRAVTLEVLQALVDAWGRCLTEEMAAISAAANATAAASPDSSDEEGEGSPVAGSSSGLNDTAASERFAVTTQSRRAANAVSPTELVGLLRAVREASFLAPQANHLALDCDACDSCFRTLAVCDRGDFRVGLVVDILLNVLELCPEAAQRCTSPDAIQSLYESFVECLALGFQLRQREIRNDFIVILIKVLQADGDAFIPLLGPLSEVLLDLACGGEMSQRAAGDGAVDGYALSPHINPTHHYTTRHEDQQAKLLSWAFLCALACRDEAIAAATLAWGFLQVLLCYIDVHCDLPAVVRWSTAQLLELQEHALLVLSEMAPMAWERFVEYNAAEVLQSYIVECPDTRLRKLAVTVLARLAVTDARGQVAEAGATPMALQLLSTLDSDSLCVDCLSILADLVGINDEQKRLFFDCGGVEIVTPFLAFAPNYHSDLRETVVLSAVDCIWSCVFGRPESEAAFIGCDGIHYYLSALETVSFKHAPYVVSALADLLNNEDSVKFVRVWRSPTTGRSAVQLLTEMWVKVSEGGDPAVPPAVAGSTATLALRSGQATVPPIVLALIDGQQSFLKVYSCMCRIGFADHRELTPQQRATLAHIELYEQLCNDAAWLRVDEDLHEHSVEAIPTDRRKLDAILSAGRDRRATLAEVQSHFLQEGADREAATNMAFYKSVIKKTEEALPEGVGVMCGMTITQAKIRKAQMLKQSFQSAQAQQQARTYEHAAQHGSNAASAAATPAATQLSWTAPSPLSNGARGEGEGGNTGKRVGGGDVATRWGDAQQAMSAEEFAVLQCINAVRTHPKSFVPKLQEYLASSDALVHTVEGPAAVREAIEVLQSARPVVAFLEVPMGMLYAVRDHMIDLAGRLDVSSQGSDGSSPYQRLLRYGQVPQRASHLQSLGQLTAEEVVLQLIIDDGIKNRIDRKTLLDPEMRYCAVSVGVHPVHGQVAIISMAYEFVDKPRELQNDINRKVHKSRPRV